MNSASVDERATVGSRRLLYATVPLAKRMQRPVIERRVLTQAAQSESTNPAASSGFKKKIVIIDRAPMRQGKIFESIIWSSAPEVDTIVTSSVHVPKNVLDSVMVFLRRICRELRTLCNSIRHVRTTSNHSIDQFSNCSTIFETILQGKILLDFGLRISFRGKSIGESLGCWERIDISRADPVFYQSYFSQTFSIQERTERLM